MTLAGLESPVQRQSDSLGEQKTERRLYLLIKLESHPIGSALGIYAEERSYVYPLQELRNYKQAEILLFLYW